MKNNDFQYSEVVGHAKKGIFLEQIIAMLWQIEVLTGQSQSVAEAVRTSGISEQRYHPWRKEYGAFIY